MANDVGVRRMLESLSDMDPSWYRIHKAADPTEGAREVTLDEAIEIAKEDPSLLRVEVL